MINRKYKFGKNFGLRVLVHQPLSNYVKFLEQEKTDNEKKEVYRYVNNKNHWTQFDFVIETRKNHLPILVVELDGPTHNTEGQQRRDEYKNGACDALNLPLIRIPYNGDASIINEDYIENTYGEVIIKKIIKSLKKNAGISKEELLRKYNDDSPQCELVKKYI